MYQTRDCYQGSALLEISGAASLAWHGTISSWMAIGSVARRKVAKFYSASTPERVWSGLSSGGSIVDRHGRLDRERRGRNRGTGKRGQGGGGGGNGRIRLIPYGNGSVSEFFSLGFSHQFAQQCFLRISGAFL
jgi:hypothetical protein